jgi:PAS domain S-box-containing protein
VQRTPLRAVPGAICLDDEPLAGAPAADGQASFEALRREHHLILNAAGEGIYGLDLQGRAHFVNPAAAAMTGHRVDELIGRSMHELVHHSHCDGGAYPKSECPIYAAFSDGLVRNVADEVFWRKDGTSFPVEYTSTPIIESGRVVGAVVVFRDISLRRFTEDRLRQALAEVQRLKVELQAENHYLKSQIQAAARATLVGESRALRRVLELVCRFAPTDATVLVTGESGTGKELVCRALHEQGPRRERALVTLNCAAISPQLMESELFGHERGAFTGAVAQRAGRFELAEGGTLFLDEIGELPLEAQAKLLRVLEVREFQRVGGTRTLTSNARIVAATNQDLRRLVEQGRFRADLYYRLHVMPIEVPPLRERPEDILALAEHFRQRSQLQWNRRFEGIAPESLERMRRHSWPGNVRELAHTIERAVLVSDGPWLELGPLDARPADARPPESAPPPSSVPPAPSARTLDEVQRSHIVSALESSGFRIAGPRGAAQKLGLHPNTLRYRMSKLGIRAGNG